MKGAGEAVPVPPCVLWKGREGAQPALSHLLTAEEQLMPKKSGKPGVFAKIS